MIQGLKESNNGEAGLVYCQHVGRDDSHLQGAYKVSVKIDPKAVPAEAAKPDGYTLDIAATGATITGNDAGGAFYGLMTLLGLIPQGGKGSIPVVCAQHNGSQRCAPRCERKTGRAAEGPDFWGLFSVSTGCIDPTEIHMKSSPIIAVTGVSRFNKMDKNPHREPVETLHVPHRPRTWTRRASHTAASWPTCRATSTRRTPCCGCWTSWPSTRCANVAEVVALISCSVFGNFGAKKNAFLKRIFQLLPYSKCT
jgi:hypothetical protein